jgi:hypothetical protein
MNPFFSKEMAQQHIGDLRREARSSRVPEGYSELGDENDGVTVRAATPRDCDAVRLLAALESVSMPTGDLLVAEVAGEVVAALPLDGSRALSDPFRRTKHLVAMLELRAQQLDGDDEPRERAFSRLRGVLRAA